MRTFLVNWAIARSGGWTLLMRIEDLDGPRVKPESLRQTLDVLAWLGLDHDGDVTVQSHDPEPYLAAMRRLADAGVVYACPLTRREIELAASAPHGDDDTPGPVRPRPDDPARFRFERLDTNYRLVVEPGVVEVDDALAGRHSFEPHDEAGDFVVWTKRGAPAYQLAVVVDDARQGVTDVVRGDDLLPSAARQHLLYEHLGATPPRWWHLPLVTGPDGRRLAKRHGDTRVVRYREAGVRPDRIIGLVASWCGIAGSPIEMTADEFRDALDLRWFRGTLGRSPIVFRPEDEAWLLAT